MVRYKGYVDFYSVYDAQTHYENLGTHRFPCLEPSEQKLESLGTYVCFFFPDLVSPRYRDRVYNAYEKYLQMRGVMSNYVEPFEDLYIPDIERSGNLYSVEKLVSRGPKSEAGVDATVFLKTLPDGVLSVGSFVSDVYNGESFSSILETMSCFQKCPGVCGNFVLCLRESFNKGAFCDACFQKEEEKRDLITKRLRVLGQLKSKALITGGRCGLGKEVLFQLAQCGLKCYTTTRFPSKFEADEDLNITPLSLDLKDPSFGDWPEVIKLLESGDIHYLILSASETLHFEKDDSLKNNKSEIEEKGLDWTNDMIRENSGIWHKTLDQHSYNEIISPLLANVGGSSALLSAFLRGVKKARNLEQIQSIPAERQRDYMCVVVTSFEGAFLPKTPFHPITNACKSALEQIVWTIQSQAKVLNCPVVLSDPGWVYTESSFGKVKGPVPISCGAFQILSPFERKQKTGYKIFHRSHVGNDRHIKIYHDKPTKIKIEPCGHIVDYYTYINPYGYYSNCPTCGVEVRAGNLTANEKHITTFVKESMRDNSSLNKDAIDYIMKVGQYDNL